MKGRRTAIREDPCAELQNSHLLKLLAKRGSLSAEPAQVVAEFSSRTKRRKQQALRELEVIRKLQLSDESHL